MKKALLTASILTLAAFPAMAQTAAPSPWALSLGLWYGHNLKESDSGSGDKTSNLTGPEIRLDYALNENWSLYGDLVVFNTMGTSSNNGWGSRVALGASHQWHHGAWHPYVGPKLGYISGRGVEDGAIVGPEVGVRYDLAGKSFLYAQLAYDHDTRNAFNKGIVNGGLGVGVKF